MKKSIFTLAAMSAAMGPVAQAEETSPIVVTATRTAQTADQTLASVTIITREEIEQSSAHSVEELLSRQAGIDIAVSGGYGKQTDMFLRGANTSHTLVLIDGLKAGSVSSGATAYQLLPLDQIERIEIVRGPRSSLYGSDAAGGVVQIFTRKGNKDTRTVFQTGAGSNHLRRDSVSNSGTVGNTRYSIALSSLETDGIDAAKPTTGFYGVDEADDDGYTNQSASINLQHNFSDSLEVNLHLLHAEGNTEYDSSATDSSTDFAQQAGGITVNYDINEMWFSSLTLGETRDESNILSAGVHDGTIFNSRRTQYKWQNDLAFNETSVLTLGVDFINDKLHSTSGHSKHSRDNTGIYAQYQSSLASQNYQISFRNDDNEAFGRETTGNFAWGFKVTDALRITASYGTAFVAPDFNDLYWPASVYYSGNLNLKPENSETTEVGFSGKHGWGQWSANLFSTEIENLIVYDGSVTPGTVNNLNKAQIDGIELALSTQIAGWNTSAQLTAQDPVDSDTGKQLHRRAKNSMSIDVNRAIGNGQLGLSLLAQSDRYNDAANTVPVSGYGVATIYGRVDLTKHWRLSANVSNIGDKDNTTVDNYNTAGRTVFVNVSYDTL